MSPPVTVALQLHWIPIADGSSRWLRALLRAVHATPLWGRLRSHGMRNQSPEDERPLPESTDALADLVWSEWPTRWTLRSGGDDADVVVNLSKQGSDAKLDIYVSRLAHDLAGPLAWFTDITLALVDAGYRIGPVGAITISGLDYPRPEGKFRHRHYRRNAVVDFVDLAFHRGGEFAYPEDSQRLASLQPPTASVQRHGDLAIVRWLADDASSTASIRRALARHDAWFVTHIPTFRRLT